MHGPNAGVSGHSVKGRFKTSERGGRRLEAEDAEYDILERGPGAAWLEFEGAHEMGKGKRVKWQGPLNRREVGKVRDRWVIRIMHKWGRCAWKQNGEMEHSTPSSIRSWERVGFSGIVIRGAGRRGLRK
jgi:hypothetical protein